MSKHIISDTRIDTFNLEVAKLVTSVLATIPDHEKITAIKSGLFLATKNITADKSIFLIDLLS